MTKHETSIADLRVIGLLAQETLDRLNALVDEFEDPSWEAEAIAVEQAIDKVGLVHAELVNQLLKRELAAGAGAGMRP